MRPFFSARTALLIALLFCFLAGPEARAATFLFDATHAETAGNADWVIDEDGGNPQRIPTPAQANITANTPETYWTGANSAWGVEMVKRGHQVETLPLGAAITFGSGTNAQDLSHYTVFVVVEPNKAFTAAERNAIVRYVQAGGSLFMCADHVNSDRDGDGKDSVAIWNDLFASNGVQVAPFGVVINQDNLSPSNETADSSVTNPLTHGAAGTVTRFLYADGASLTIDPTRNPSVRAAIWTSSSHTNSNAMVAYGTFGAGRFVAVGDSSPIDDGTGASGNNLFNGWDDRNGNDARLIINASLWLASAQTPPPANDNFANAIVLTGAITSASGTNVLATKETGEPNHGGNVGGKSVWWNWTAPASGEVVLNTNGSNFATLLGVYTGASVSGLTAVVPTSSGAGTITFNVSSGVNYRIAVDGSNGASGTIQLSLTLTVPDSGPATIASWNFDAPPFSAPLPADNGNAVIDFTGWGGVVTNFGGVSGEALALQGTAGNGTYIEIDFSMAGYSGLSLTFATRGTATGYTTGTWSWSVNGGGFTTLAGVNTATTSSTWATKVLDLSTISALNNADMVRLRYTLSGSSGASPNVRVDDLSLNAIAMPVVTIAASNPNGYERGAVPASVIVSSSIPAPAGGLAIGFQLSGSATPPGVAGADYTVSGNSSATTITIPAGATDATLSLKPVADTNPTEFDEIATVTVLSGAGYFVGAANAVSIAIHDDTPYNSTWASQYPGFNGSNSAPELDIEKDGISNFAEFAFNGNPLLSDPSILPSVGQINLADPNDGGAIKPYPTISFRRRTDALNLIYAPESSADLSNWDSSVQFVSTTPGPGPNIETVVYRGLFPLTGAGSVSRTFLRVHLSLDEN